MERHRDVLPGGDPGLPDDECIRSGGLGPEQLRVGFLFFAFLPQGIEGNEDLDTEAVCVGAQLGNILKTVARRLAGPEIRPGNIYGIGTAVDGCDADILVPGGSQQLEGLHYFRASSIFLASAPYLGSLAALV